jgi:hypothetical protein
MMTNKIIGFKIINDFEVCEVDKVGKRITVDFNCVWMDRVKNSQSYRQRFLDSKNVAKT